MKSAFDANVSRSRPQTRRDVGFVVDPEKTSPVQSSREAGPASVKAVQDDAAKRLIEHIKERSEKKRQKTVHPAVTSTVSVKPKPLLPVVPQPPLPEPLTEVEQEILKAVALQVEAAPAPAPREDTARNESMAEMVARIVASYGPVFSSTGHCAPEVLARSPERRPVAVAVDDNQTGQTLHQGRDRIDRLKERLTASTRPNGSVSGDSEPWATAEATRLFVDKFRKRITMLTEEREVMQRTLDVARTDINNLKAELSARNQSAEDLEKTAKDRIQLAQELMGEAETLASERDRALARIAELKLLDEQQTRLLSEAEEALSQKDLDLEAAKKREAEMLYQLETQSKEIDTLQAALSRRTAERDELMERVVKLETDLRTFTDSRVALAEIKRLVDSARV